MIRIAGFGARPGAETDSLRAALSLTGESGITGIATIAERAAVLGPLAQTLDLPLHIVTVAGVITPTQSDRVQTRYQTGSVAEAAALTAVGPGARLTTLRVTSPDGMATCAVAIGEGS